MESLVELYRVRAYGNAGNQIKVAGTSKIVNSLIVGNCNYFYKKPFAQEKGDVSSGDSCRAGSASISVSFNPANQSYVINSTIASEGWASIEAMCHINDFPDAPPCNGNERFYLINNILIGYPNVTSPGDLPDLVGDGDTGHFTRAETLDYNIIYRVQDDGLNTGVHNIKGDPLLQGMDDINIFDAQLLPGSPAIDTGFDTGALRGLIPSIDLVGTTRPQGSGVDREAYEYRTEFTLTVSKWGTGNGIIMSSPAGINCGDDCAKKYKQGTTVNLSASADDISRFSLSSGDCKSCSTEETCNISMNTNKSCIAIFNQIEPDAGYEDIVSDPTEDEIALDSQDDVISVDSKTEDTITDGSKDILFSDIDSGINGKSESSGCSCSLLE